ncbi:uncharacterized protein LOC102810117 [Saccoglossus kowalevskii]
MKRKMFTPNYYLHPNPKNTSAKNILVFVHNQKSGGSTLKACIDNITKKLHLPAYKGIWSGAVTELIQSFNSKNVFQNKFYVSENTFGICDDFNEPLCSYFTLLRDPYERIVSSHEFCKTHLGDPLCTASDARVLNVSQWALHQGSYFFRQLMYNGAQICSQSTLNSKILPILKENGYQGNKKEHVPCWYVHKLLLDDKMTKEEKDILLDFILQHLQDWFAVVAITEEYDMSLKLLQTAFNLPFYDLCKGLRVESATMGVTDIKKKLAHYDLVKKLKSQLQQDSEVYNALYYDIKIYEKALEIFHLQKIAYFKRFE